MFTNMNVKIQTPAQQAQAAASMTGKPLFGAPSPAASSPASGSAGASTPKAPLTSRERKERTKANKEAKEVKDREAAAQAKAKLSESVAPYAPVVQAKPEKEIQKNVKGIIPIKELKPLMYGAGDAQGPLDETADVLEDMVLNYLSDLCRAPPSILPQPPHYHPVSSNPQTLTPTIIRERLASNQHMRKQLTRFDELSFLQKDFVRFQKADKPSNRELARLGGESAQRNVTTVEEDEAFEKEMAQRNAEVGEEDLDEEEVGAGAGTPKKRKRAAPGAGAGGGGKKKKLIEGGE